MFQAICNLLLECMYFGFSYFFTQTNGTLNLCTLDRTLKAFSKHLQHSSLIQETDEKRSSKNGKLLYWIIPRMQNTAHIQVFWKSHKQWIIFIRHNTTLKQEISLRNSNGYTRHLF